MHRYYLSLGANLGKREETLQTAVALLKEETALQVTAVSSMYETPPWGKTDQPVFINMACTVETALSGQALLTICQHIEQTLGRVRHEKWGARTIDIDIVYSDDVISHTDTLEIPHPYVTQRAFVLVPLQEIAPDVCISGQPLSYWLQQLPDVQDVKKIRNEYEMTKRRETTWKKS